MQCVILVGGLGTRLGALVADCPKPMLPVDGRPFLEHLVGHFRRFGVERFLLLAGYRAEAVAEHFVTDPAVTVLAEPEPLGTGGALRYAAQAGALEETFLMANGDSLFDFNVLDLVLAHRRSGMSGTLALRAVEDASRYGVVDLSASGGVSRMRERPDGRGPGLINGGVYVLDRTVAERLPPGASSLERDLLPALAGEGRLGARIYDGAFIDIGVPDAYGEACAMLPLRRPAVFFDRDGVLNHDAGYTHRTEDLAFLDGAVEAVRVVNDAGWFAFVVTNQAGVARGLYDVAAVERFHARMNALLAAEGAHIDDFRFCPHHPDGTVDRWRRACDWRKPGPGMIVDLMRAWPVDAAKSVLVGDKASDLEAAQAAGIRGVAFTHGNLAALVRNLLAEEDVSSRINNELEI